MQGEIWGETQHRSKRCITEPQRAGDESHSGNASLSCQQHHPAATCLYLNLGKLLFALSSLTSTPSTVPLFSYPKGTLEPPTTSVPTPFHVTVTSCLDWCNHLRRVSLISLLYFLTHSLPYNESKHFWNTKKDWFKTLQWLPMALKSPAAGHSLQNLSLSRLLPNRASSSLLLQRLRGLTQHLCQKLALYVLWSQIYSHTGPPSRLVSTS